MIIENFFPINIGYVFNPNHSKIEDRLVKHCYGLKKKIPPGGDNWIARTYNTSRGKYDIYKDSKFKDLNAWIDEQVDKYISQLSLRCTRQGAHGWLNVYKKHDFQEYHNHVGYIISCVYFLKSDSKASSLFFKSPVQETSDIGSDLLVKHQPNGVVVYQPDAGKLIIFRSYLEHCVGQHLGTKDRITLAYNYN